jgi:hypothetical protein
MTFQQTWSWFLKVGDKEKPLKTMISMYLSDNYLVSSVLVPTRTVPVDKTDGASALGACVWMMAGKYISQPSIAITKYPTQATY